MPVEPAASKITRVAVDLAAFFLRVDTAKDPCQRQLPGVTGPSKKSVSRDTKTASTNAINVLSYGISGY